MGQTLSRAERDAAFAAAAKRLHQGLEDYCDQHADASFGEIEQEARRLRRVLLGETLALVVNGRDDGYRRERPRCEQCGGEMEFEGYRRWGVSSLEGDVQLRRAYYLCPACSGQGFPPPLDRKLKLRADHWSEGAAQVATEQGLQAKSFALAATAYSRAVGGAIGAESVRQITEGGVPPARSSGKRKQCW